MSNDTPRYMMTCILCDTVCFYVFIMSSIDDLQPFNCETPV